MDSLIVEIVLILLLILVNGVFSMAELAVLSARKTRLNNLAENGDKNAATAVDLINDPGNFLSTIQIGITVVGVFTGAIGGAALSHPLAAILAKIQVLEPYADGIAFIFVVVIITYLSLVLGELAPKQIALRNADRLALFFARPMKRLSRMAGFLVRMLSVSTEFVLSILHQKGSGDAPVTEEEVRLMLTQATQEGVFEPAEEKIVTQVFRMADRKINTFLTPRTEILWLDVDDDWEINRAKILDSSHTCFPVAEENLDNVIGLVLAKDVLDQYLRGDLVDIRSLAVPAAYLPENLPAIEVIERLKHTRSHLALIIDEYGGIQGLVTINDILEMMVEGLPGADPSKDEEITLRADGSYLVDGMILIEQFQESFGLSPAPLDHEGDYQTLGGYVMTTLGRIPSTGDTLRWDDCVIEVVDMDGRRVDKLLVIRLPEPETSEDY